MSATVGKRIIVTGYPKSGNTWVSRLVADVVGCPVSGFLGLEQGDLKPDLGQEGEGRRSDFCVVKSHLIPSEIILNEGDCIVYVMRDCRAVLASSIAFFGYADGQRADINTRSSSVLWRIMESGLRRLCRNDVQWNAYDSLVYGSRNLSNYLGRAWSDHVAAVNSDGLVFLVRYEELLADTVKGMRNLSGFLGLEVDESQLVAVVERQDFD